MMNDLLFFFSEAIIGMRRSALMITVSVATITVSLLIFGLFSLVSINVTNLGDYLASKLELRIYLDDAVTKRDRLAFQDRISKMASVERVEFVGKNIAWEAFQDQFPNMGLSTIENDNPLPDSFRVFLMEGESLPKLSAYVQKTFPDEVEDVMYGGDVAEQIQYLSRLTRIGGLALVGLFSLATLLIVMNTIRLTVIARQIEIEIMQLVGATHQFIRWPFLIEGLLIGLMGSGLSVLVIKPFYGVLVGYIQSHMPYFPLVLEGALLGKVYFAVVGVGIGLGVIGAFIAVSRSLKEVSATQ